jgi:hypothetical protein
LRVQRRGSAYFKGKMIIFEAIENGAAAEQPRRND